jgi:hypothetical protein
MLVASANVTMQSSGSLESVLQFELGSPATAGTTFDQLVMKSGTFAVGGAELEILPKAGIVLGQAYPIVLASGGSIDYSTAFSNLASGTVYNDGVLAYSVSYSSSAIDVTVSSVPEPVSAMSLFSIISALCRRKRSVRRL